jgi:hypothetical protein
MILKQEVHDIKDLSVKYFTRAFPLGGKEWVFDVRQLPSADPRFEGTLTGDTEQPVEFVMIRTSIGKWLISGDSLPLEVEEYAQEIGKAFEEESSRLKDHRSSESNPGVKPYVGSARSRMKSRKRAGSLRMR